MLENATVTLPLADFDTMRDGEREYRRMAGRLANCFDYKYVKHHNPEPPECKDCKRDIDCPDCEINAANPLCTETLTVDVGRLIRTAKEYALYGKDVETDLDAIEVTAKTELTLEP